MFCPHCGAQVSEDVNFCPKCGQRIPEEDRVESSFDYGSREKTGRKIWPFLVIGISVVLIAAIVVIYFTVIRPKQNEKTARETITAQTTMEETTTEETTAAETTTAQKTKADSYPKTMYGTASDGLLLRTGPGTQNEAIYLINYGRAVTVDKVKNGWAHASIDGMTGWCSMDYLTENAKKIKELPTISSEGRNPNQLADPINRVQSGNEPHGFVNTPGDTLNLRYGPGEQYGVIAEIPNGTSVVEYGWDGDWIYTEYKGQYGWIHSGYVIFGGGMAKPAIYLYPEKTMDISVQIKLKEGRFTRTAPEADGNWLVTAQPDGTLKDKATGKTYDYIFWESDSKPPYDWSEGYVVEGFASKGFLEEILPKMGLNEKECREFVDYWVPRMQKNPLNLISFQTTCYTDVAQMKVKPKPDSVLRVFMTFKPVKTPISVKAPKIKPFERKGFTVVEWGGSEVE